MAVIARVIALLWMRTSDDSESDRGETRRRGRARPLGGWRAQGRGVSGEGLAAAR